MQLQLRLEKRSSLVGERMHKDGTTSKLVGPAVFAELAENSGSNMGTFASKLPALYSFIDVAENILNAAKARIAMDLLSLIL